MRRLDLDALEAAERHVGSLPVAVQLDPHVLETLGGEHVVHAQQQYRGLSIYPHSKVIQIAADGGVTTSGDPLLDLEDIDVIPKVGAKEAARAAFRHLHQGSATTCHTKHAPLFTDRRYRPRMLAAFPMPNRPTVLTAGPFSAPVQANLVIFSGAKTLAWLVTCVVRHRADFTLLIGASGDHAGDVLYCAAEAASAACRALVYLFNPSEAPATEVDFPRPPADYPPGIRPQTVFHDWVDHDQTIGNNVEMMFGNQTPKLRAIASRFATTPGSDGEQVVNAFFLCNFAHDFFSLIGFGEAEGNFQQKNFSGFGVDRDRLIVNIVTQAQGEANMRAQNDGFPPELSLGVWKNGSTGHPTALDADIVLHEYMHGVSQRLVGGRLKMTALAEPQSLALGEAWSDYFAITIQNFYRQSPRFTFGAFASNNASGVRPKPYDQVTADFGQLGTPPFNEQHGAGSIFAAALIQMQEELRALLGHAAGHETGWRLVIASLKKVKANPNFIEARNAILDSIAALMSPQAAAIEAAIRRAFAQFGMGRNARCDDTSFRGTPDSTA